MLDRKKNPSDQVSFSGPLAFLHKVTASHAHFCLIAIWLAITLTREFLNPSHQFDLTTHFFSPYVLHEGFLIRNSSYQHVTADYRTFPTYINTTY